MTCLRNFPNASLNFSPSIYICIDVTIEVKFPSSHPYMCIQNVECKVRIVLYIKTGILQGSIVGPLFFSIYINAIVKCTEKFNCILYADNTTLNSTIDSFGKEIHIIE